MIDIIERAETALEGVTDAPWVAEFSGEQGDCVIPHDAQSTREAVCVTRLYHKTADARFIAWCRTGVPELIAELKAARAKNEQLMELCASADSIMASMELLLSRQANAAEQSP